MTDLAVVPTVRSSRRNHVPVEPVWLVPLIAAAAIALPAAAQEVTLKVHHFWAPTAMPPSTLLAPWCDKIAKDSNNRMKCQIYPAMQLGGAPPQLIQQAMDGVADIVWTLPGYTAGRFPMMEVFELPFMSQSAEATSQAAWEYYTQYGYKEFPGIKALAVNVHDNGYIHTVEQADQGDGGFQGPQDARADATDEQAPRRARRNARSRCRCRRSATRCRRGWSTATCCRGK